jgi:hypothetical protein
MCVRAGTSSTSCNPHADPGFTCSTGVVQDSFLCAVCEQDYYHFGMACVPCSRWERVGIPVLAVLCVAILLVFLWRSSKPVKPDAQSKHDRRQSAVLELSIQYLHITVAFIDSGNCHFLFPTVLSVPQGSVGSVVSLRFTILSCVSRSFDNLMSIVLPFLWASLCWLVCCRL